MSYRKTTWLMRDVWAVGTYAHEQSVRMARYLCITGIDHSALCKSLLIQNAASITQFIDTHI